MSKIYYLTHRVLEDGITETHGKDIGGGALKDLDLHGDWFYYKPYWHRTKKSAIAHAEKIRARRIWRLEEKIAKIEEIVFK